MNFYIVNDGFVSDTQKTQFFLTLQVLRRKMFLTPNITYKHKLIKATARHIQNLMTIITFILKSNLKNLGYFRYLGKQNKMLPLRKN